MKAIQLQADGPARIAHRLMVRLLRDGLISEATKKDRVQRDLIIEAMADEIHQAAIDATLRLAYES